MWAQRFLLSTLSAGECVWRTTSTVDTATSALMVVNDLHVISTDNYLLVANVQFNVSGSRYLTSHDKIKSQQ